MGAGVSANCFNDLATATFVLCALIGVIEVDPETGAVKILKYVAVDDVGRVINPRSEEHTSELQSHSDLVCRLLLEKKKRSCMEKVPLVSVYEKISTRP